MSGDNYEYVRTEKDGDIKTVYVDRPDAMNSVNPEVVRQLAAAVESGMASADVRVLVLTGTGDRAFIGGGDIKDFQERSGTWFKQEFRSAVRDLETALEGGPKPVIAAVNGVALGGGTEIALMCDMVLASETAEFGLPEISLGIIPGTGGTQRLTHLVGYLKAKELVLTGRRVPAEEAVQIGMINEAVSDDLYGRVYDLAEQLANGAPYAQWFAKEAINQTRQGLESGLRLEETLAALTFETSDKEEGLEAFVEQRDADFGTFE